MIVSVSVDKYKKLEHKLLEFDVKILFKKELKDICGNVYAYKYKLFSNKNINIEDCVNNYLKYGKFKETKSLESWEKGAWVEYCVNCSIYDKVFDKTVTKINTNIVKNIRVNNGK